MGRVAGWICASTALALAAAFGASAGVRWLLDQVDDLSAGRLVHGAEFAEVIVLPPARTEAAHDSADAA